MNNVFEIRCNDYNHRRNLCDALLYSGYFVRAFQRLSQDGKNEWWVEYFDGERWEVMQNGR